MHTAVFGSSGIKSQLVEDARDMLFHHGLGDPQAFGDAAVGLALGHRSQHLALARGEPLDGAVPFAATEDSPHDLGVERTPAVGDPFGRLNEVLRVAYA